MKTKRITAEQIKVISEIINFDWDFKPEESNFNYGLRLAIELPLTIKKWQRRLLDDLYKIKNKNTKKP